MQNKTKAGVALLVVGCFINIVPSLYTAIFGALLVAAAFFMIKGEGINKSYIPGLIAEIVSALIYGFILAASMGKDNIKVLGIQWAVVVVVGLVITAAEIAVITYLKRKNK